MIFTYFKSCISLPLKHFTKVCFLCAMLMTTLFSFLQGSFIVEEKSTHTYPWTQVCIHCPFQGSGVLSHQQTTMQGEYARNLKVILLLWRARLCFPKSRERSHTIITTASHCYCDQGLIFNMKLTYVE